MYPLVSLYFRIIKICHSDDKKEKLKIILKLFSSEALKIILDKGTSLIAQKHLYNSLNSGSI